jgi:hypothetical protein
MDILWYKKIIEAVMRNVKRTSISTAIRTYREASFFIKKVNLFYEFLEFLTIRRSINSPFSRKTKKQ